MVDQLSSRPLKRAQMRHPNGILPSWLRRLLCAGALVVIPAQAEAFEFNGGVSVGGIQIGTDPRLAVSTSVGLLWRKESGFLLEAFNMFSLIPGARVGVYDRTAAALGYALKSVDISLGPSLSIYSMPVCGIVICNRVVGIAPGGHARPTGILRIRSGCR